jgi:hypothetical protein
MATILRGLVVAVVVLVLAGVEVAHAELYRWVDEDGIPHYTADLESIPPKMRASATVSSPPRAPDGPPQRPAVDPTIVPYKAGSHWSSRRPSTARRSDCSSTRLRSHHHLAGGRVPAGLSGAIGSAVNLRGVGGRVTGVEVVVGTLDVAGSRMGNFPVIVHDAGVRNADGLLGRDVLDAFTLTVDAVGGRATIVPR